MKTLLLLLICSAGYGQISTKKDSAEAANPTNPAFVAKMKLEHKRDSLKKAAIKKQPSARPKTTTKAKSQ